jgi:ribosome-associated translation inhibitor RaiA
MESEETLELGGNIQLSGFSELVPGSMTIIKKLVGTYTKHYMEECQDFQQLHLTLKPIHKTGDVPKLFEIHAKVVHGGRVIVSQCEDRNVFTAVDTALKKIQAEIGHGKC